MKNLAQLIWVVLLGVHFNTLHSQINADVEGDIQITDGTPQLILYDNGLSENRIEGSLGEFGDFIDLQSYRGPLRFLTGITGVTAERMRISAAGDVGIGTGGPVARLHVQTDFGASGGIHIAGPGSIYDARLSINNGGGTHYLFDDGTNGNSLNLQSANDLDLWAGNQRRLMINATGEIGIGVAPSPAAKLRIKPESGEHAIFINDIASGTQDLRIAMENGGGFHYIFDDFDNGHSFEIESANDLAFNTNGGNERMRILDNGRILVNTSSSSNSSLNVVGISNDFYAVRGGHNASSSAPTRGIIGIIAGYQAAQEQIGVEGAAATTGANSWAGSFNGDLRYTGTLSPPSDRRFKKDIISLEPVLEKVMQLQTKSYSFNHQDYEGLNLAQGKQIGFISQDVQEVFPELIENTTYRISKETTYDYLAMNYMGIIPILTKAIQEQQELINQLSARLNAQQTEIDQLKN